MTKLTLSLLSLILSFSSHAVIIPVTNTNDNGVGSLRDAVAISVAGDVVDATGIAGTITLTSGHIDITVGKDISILGPGAAVLSIDCNFASRAFNVFSADVIISNVSIINGLTNDNEGGGGIRAVFGSDLTLSYCIISNCEASESLNTRGGGIDIVTYDPNTWNENGAVTVIIDYCQIENCRSYIGGGVRMVGNSEDFTIDISNTTFKGNSTGAYGALGSGNDGGAMELIPHQNSIAAGTNVSIINSTYSANTTGGPSNSRAGGALSLGTGFYTIISSTFTTNNTPTNGGGISFWGMDGTCTLTNTIVAQNIAGGTGKDINGTITSGDFNLIGEIDGATWIPGTADITGTIGSPVDALLSGLAPNGGLGETHAIACASPAIDAGGLNPVLDQRDLPRVCDPDIGAFEYQTICNCTLLDTVFICSGDSIVTDGLYQSTSGVYGDTVLLVISSSINSVAAVCINDPAFLLTADSIGGTWTGNGITNGATGEFSPSSAGIGIHTISYEVQYTLGGIPYTCTSDIIIEVTGQLDATITPQADLCESDPTVNLAAADVGGVWTGTGVTNQTVGTFDPSVTGAGTHTITYTITSGSCGDIGTIDIVVLASEDASFSYASNVYCITDLNPAPALQSILVGVFIITGAGIIDPITGIIDLVSSGAGNFTVTYTTAGACPGTETFDVEIVDAIDVVVDLAGPFCANDVSLTLITNGTEGTWSGIGVDPNSGVFDPSIAGTGSWEIIYTSPFLCGINADTITIIVNPVPIADAGVDQSMLQGTSTSLLGNGGGTYLWDPSSGLSCPTCANTAVNIDATTEFTLIVTNAEGCSSQDAVTIFIIEEEHDLFVPTIFSPNGDGNNDNFVIEGTGLNNYLLRVFNRWGELIFESESQGISWDGTQRNKPLNTAVFAYVLTYTNDSGIDQRKTGNVTLIK
jgi:gliding motility-associated-like protein